MQNTRFIAAALAGTFPIAAALVPPAVDACTRVTYKGTDSLILTGRSMDWMTSIGTDLWAFPAGLSRDGGATDNSLKWSSKYGSVIASGFGEATTDGMNTEGLVANLLFLADAEYGVRDPARPGLSIGAWPQYVLDNFATVAEAVAALRREPFQLVAGKMPDGNWPTMHLSISDALGDSAILEYIAGRLVIHHDSTYQVMTNEPPYDQQLTLNSYWEQIGGAALLPGTSRPADRFVRASYYLNDAPKTSDPITALASLFSIMRNVSVPIGTVDPNRPNVAATQWRVVADQKNRIYYFESTSHPNVFWVAMKNLDLSPGAAPRHLVLDQETIYAGETSKSFVPSTPFLYKIPGA